MKNSVIPLVAILFSLHAGWAGEQILWKLDLESYKPGDELLEAAYDTGGNVAPQKVWNDGNDKITVIDDPDGGKRVLLFSKQTATSYRPAVDFDAGNDNLFTSGKLIFEWEALVEDFQLVDGSKANTLISQGFIGDNNQERFRISFVGATNPGGNFINFDGFAAPGTLEIPHIKWDKGEKLRFRVELDLDKKEATVSVNGEEVFKHVNEEKFAAVRCFRIRDGAAIGGSYGETITARFSNITIAYVTP